MERRNFLDIKVSGNNVDSNNTLNNALFLLHVLFIQGNDLDKLQNSLLN